MDSHQLLEGRRRVLSGMRPTGRLHLGNYMGALYNWVKLQREFDCFFFIADWHALTTDYADPSLLKQNVFEIALDFLAAGLDPQQSAIFIQSHVPEHAELHLLLSMLTPVSWLERVPTYKDQQEQLREKDLATYGFLGYPLLQSADILLYRPEFVPVGQDQVAHVEITREIARRFNQFYSGKHTIPAPAAYQATARRDLLPEPQVLLTPSPKLPGIDGRKMSKSYGNSILLTDPRGEIHRKMHSMSNGGQRPTQYDPGDPTICPVGDMHRVFSDPDVVKKIEQACRTATIRCEECKLLAAESIMIELQPIQANRRRLESHPDTVWDALELGREKASRAAQETMRALRAVTGLSRDRSGVRLDQSLVPPALRQNIRDLTDFGAWWNLEPKLLLRNLREHWRMKIVPSETALKQDTEGVWLTRNHRRVFVTAATEHDSKWFFSVKAKSYEILVLLCWAQDRSLHDFVIPQKLYVSEWTTAKKAAGKNDLEFSVTLENDQYWLRLPLALKIGITATEADYGIIGN
jgi:tryptophanyl-tRNA synthetase